MASITKTISRRGIIRWRVFFRRKGRPSITLSFASEREARDFVDIHELEYIKDPLKYVNYEKSTRYERKIEREFLNK